MFRTYCIVDNSCIQVYTGIKLEAKKKTKLNPKLGKYFIITIVIVMPIVMIFVVGGAVGGGLGALITLCIVWVIAKLKNIPLYVLIESKN